MKRLTPKVIGHLITKEQRHEELCVKVALVHYWCVNMRGGEKVLEALCDLYREADIYTHVYVPERMSDTIRRHTVYTTFISRLPRASSWYKAYLPLMPLALELLDLRAYDLVISSESGPAKGIITRADALHICYCHTPMRYIWNMYHEYQAGKNAVAKAAIALAAHRLRQWDVTTATRVDYFVANSQNVAERIGKYYRRAAAVIHPPVDTASFRPGVGAQADDFYLCAGQLTAYKRADVAIEAFNRLGKTLVVIGDGEMREKLRRRAAPNIKFLGWVGQDTLREYYARCRALIFPGEEDFGIVPLEAMASGRPVIALGRGGALETVIPGETGVLFHEPSAEALIDAIFEFECVEASFAPDRLVRHAERFDKARFKRDFGDFVAGALQPNQTSSDDRARRGCCWPHDGLILTGGASTDREANFRLAGASFEIGGCRCLAPGPVPLAVNVATDGHYMAVVGRSPWIRNRNGKFISPPARPDARSEPKAPAARRCRGTWNPPLGHWRIA